MLITCVPPGPFLWNSSCQLSSHSMLDYPNMHCSMNLLHLSKRYSTHLFKFLRSPFFLLYITFISFYILECHCNNKSSFGIVQLSFNGMHCFCGWVLKCISIDGNICSWTLITVAIFIFCSSSTQLCISDCVWNAAIEACAYMTRWATTVAAYLYATWITLWSSRV